MTGAICIDQCEMKVLGEEIAYPLASIHHGCRSFRPFSQLDAVFASVPKFGGSQS